MKKLSGNEILEGIKTRSSEVLRMVYAENYPAIKSYIQRNNGNSQDAEDIFQESLILIYKKLNAGNIKLESGFKTYLFSVCRFLWLKELRRNRFEFSDKMIMDFSGDYESHLYDDIDKFRKQDLIQKYLLKLGPECRMLLMLFYDNVSVEEIRDSLGYESSASTRKKKFNCKRKLIELIKNDPLYREIMDL